MINLEKNFTSTGNKLLANAYYLSQLQAGEWRPKHAEIAPYEPCNLNCDFCSVYDRDRKNSMTKEQVTHVLDQLNDLQCRTISWTGGGEFTLAPYANDVIEYARNLHFEQGMITNGTRLNYIHFDNLHAMTWIRVSMNGLDQGATIYLNHVPVNVDLGMSYVISEKNKDNLQERLKDLSGLMEQYNVKYLRLVPDCSDMNMINWVRENVPQMVKDKKNIFVQTKHYDHPTSCLWGYVKPFINQNKVFTCSANPLIDGKFSNKHILGDASNLKEIWKNPKSFDPKVCGLCFYKDQNDLLEAILQSREVEHRNFV